MKKKITRDMKRVFYKTPFATHVDMFMSILSKGPTHLVFVFEIGDIAYIAAPKDAAMAERMLAGFAAFTAELVGPERALDIATGATVGRRSDNP